MGLAPLDYVTIIAYLALCVGIGIKVGGRPSSTSAYFKTDGNVPWWAVSFSIVATETSMLTVISIPAVAYLGTLEFLQIVVGYIAGRILISFLILPSYFAGEQETAYTFFRERFGPHFQRAISALFLITRLLADGVRLFAAAIPIKLITGLDYPPSIAIIGALTLAYTYYGGLKSVIWIDVLQLVVYITGGFLILYFIGHGSSGSIWSDIAGSGKLEAINWPHSWSELFLTPYNLVGAFIGGLFLTMASHGTDHLIVQRLLACRDLDSARKALVSSGFFVFFQFALFLLVGLFLYVFYAGADVSALGLQKADEILPNYVIHQMPAGLSGFIIAGLFAAAMSTLSSSLSALSSSTLFDIFPTLSKRDNNMQISRWLMIVWTFVFIGFAISFSSMNNPVIELGLGIAGFTYGGLLGAFLLGRYTNIQTQTALVGLVACVGGMTIVIKFGNIAWPWYTFLGVAIYGLTALLAHYGLQLRRAEA